jgi:hypothetical protein
MFQILLRYSGLLASLVAWLFVVRPAMRHGIDGKRQTITTATVENKNVLKTVSFGLTIGAFLQGLFLFYIIQRFDLPVFGIGSILYLTANIATILVAIFHYEKHPKLHETFADYYFIVSPLSLAFIGFTAMKNGVHLFTISVLVVILYFIGSWRILKKFGKNAMIEMWAFAMLSIWTLIFTIV